MSRILLLSAALLLLACAAAACAQPARVPHGVNVSSERSEYSPTARLAVALAPLRLATDTIDIVIDSGSLAVPGESFGDTAVVMRNFYLTALLVTTGAGREETELPRPWHAEAQSDSLPVVDGLRHGERRAIGPMRFRIPRPANFDPGRAWLVFRLTGIVIPRVARMEGQQGEVRVPRGPRFRVYACADWNLAGQVDRDRARRMRESYLAAC